MAFPGQLKALFPDTCPNGVFIGPEVYYLKRTREGGTYQEGVFYGGRMGYERLKRCHWYLGLDALYAMGNLEGRSGTGKKLKSELEDTLLEGRLGYTFQYKCGLHAFITPFFGLGYFHETNHFVHPTELRVKFTDKSKFVSFGFLTGLQFHNDWNFGLNYKMRWMIDGRSNVNNDPDFDEIRLIMNNEIHYRFEAPISYQFCCRQLRFETGVIPFFEYRHFGGRANYPFDFIDTRHRLWGARAEFAYRF